MRTIHFSEKTYMIEFIFNNASLYLETYAHLLRGEHEKSLLHKVTTANKKYKHIDFYALDAEKQINDKLTMIRLYIDEISPLFNRLQQISPREVEISTFINKLTSVLLSLESKKDKLTRLQTRIPEGMLDAKRALFAMESDFLSDSLDENNALKSLLVTLKNVMHNTNKEYNCIIKQGGSIHFILFETTKLYWMKLREYKNCLKSVIDYIEQCSQLTKTGELVRRCLDNAHINTPSTNHAMKLLDKATRNKITINRLMNDIGFSSINGRNTCAFLKDAGKPFFHIPHNENMYHIDYDPTCDLAEAAGNCSGESKMFIHALSIGRFKRLCPEAGTINFQLEQTRRWPFEKTTIGEGQTDVSAETIHQSLQWEDVKKVLIDNPHFNTGDICGMHLSMNEYTQAQKGFTTGHVAVLAKLDVTQSLYKYIVFEKELGVFGLVDDESLEYVFSQQIMAIYEEVNYSKIKLTKYGEATPSTYQFISKIKPIAEDVPQIIANQILDKPNAHSFFETVNPLSTCSSSEPGIPRGFVS